MAVVAAIVLLVLALWVAPNQELTDRLSALFLTLPASWLASLTFERFLIALTLFSAFLAVIALAAAVILGLAVGAKSTRLSQRGREQETTVRREASQLKDRSQQQHEQLGRLGQAIAARLDRRFLTQAMVEAASRITSTPQANSLVSLWIWNFEKEVFRFEMGRYCDASLFTQTDWAPTVPPWSTLTATQKPALFPTWEGIKPLLQEEKAKQLGAAGSVLLVPLIVENSVLGALLICCPAEVLTGYEAQRLFYEAAWAQLALGLAIAVQGEVAILDRLTGTHNRDYLMKRLTQEIERANRFRLPISLLILDIDNFKAVNDTLGHLQGDAVLKIIAKIVKKEVRAMDLVGRYGGEEFLIMLPETGYGEEATSATGSLLVAERIRKAIYDEFCQMQKPLNLTVSIGVSVRRMPEHQQMTATELIRLADEQLYRAKTTGKNKVCVALPDQPQPLSS